MGGVRTEERCARRPHQAPSPGSSAPFTTLGAPGIPRLQALLAIQRLPRAARPDADRLAPAGKPTQRGKLTLCNHLLRQVAHLVQKRGRGNRGPTSLCGLILQLPTKTCPACLRHRRSQLLLPMAPPSSRIYGAHRHKLSKPWEICLSRSSQRRSCRTRPRTIGTCDQC